ncbi:hypothetical protein IFR05_006393 [Cadophora sp. M221]|nr:hypothetical protein IFR05_006393 [Cadophora sp. M221]
MDSKILFPPNELEQLETIFGLRTNVPRDVVIVSFDLEINMDNPMHNRYNQITQIGVSMLDTRKLSGPLNKPLTTKHIIVCCGHKRFTHERAKFHFGSSEHIVRPQDTDEAIVKLLHIPDERASGRYRDIILVGHGLRSDLLLLRKRGVLFEEIKTIAGILDTTNIAKEVLEINFRLDTLLRFLRYPLKNIHNAGNDANYALRAILMLVYHGLRSSCLSLEATRILSNFKSLALEPIPDTTQRSALHRALKPRCEDFIFAALRDDNIDLFHDF